MDYCTECGNEIGEGIKFCSNCGRNVYKNELLDNTGSEKRFRNIIGYFKWVKSTILHPSDEGLHSSAVEFGVTSFVIQSLLSSFAIFVLGKTITEYIIELFLIYSHTDYSEVTLPKSTELYMKLLLLSMIYYFIFALVGFLCRRYLIDRITNFKSYLNQLAGYSNLMIFFLLLLIIFILACNPINGTGSSSKDAWDFVKNLIVIGTIISNFWFIAYNASIITVSGKMKIDRLYAALVAFIVDGIGLYVLFKIITNAIL